MDNPRRNTLTHREFHRLYDAFEHETDPPYVPRDPIEYHPWEHFIDGCQDPEVDIELIERIMADGDVYPTEGDNRYRFLWTDDVSLRTYILVVRLRTENLPHEAVTIYRWNHQ
jgi:hypothetical protein